MLAKHLPARFASPGMAQLLLEFMPGMPLGRVLEGLMGGFAGIDGEIKSALYAELGEIEV